MTTSAARIEANRRNSLKSTGPKTVAGKAAARLNAFRHGMVGRGNLVGPEEDAAVVTRRTELFVSQLRASGAMGHLLAHRAAVLSVRMENLAVGEMITVAAAEQQARTAFDADRGDAIVELLAAAGTPDGDPAPALEALADCPDGLDQLLAAWLDLRARLGSADPGSAPEQVARWLGVPTGLIDLPRRVEEEIHRLQARAATMAPAARAIERARHDAGVLARFDSSPEATLARRYEAAAERGMYRAIRAIAEINREAGASSTEAASELSRAMQSAAASLGKSPGPLGPAPPTPPAPPAPSVPIDPLASFRAEGIDPLASLCAGIAPGSRTGPTASNPVVPLDRSSPEPRTRRPDLRKLNQKRAKKRR